MRAGSSASTSPGETPGVSGALGVGCGATLGPLASGPVAGAVGIVPSVEDGDVTPSLLEGAGPIGSQAAGSPAPHAGKIHVPKTASAALNFTMMSMRQPRASIRKTSRTMHRFRESANLRSYWTYAPISDATASRAALASRTGSITLASITNCTGMSCYVVPEPGLRLRLACRGSLRRVIVSPARFARWLQPARCALSHS